jgi:hypothetical protein
VAIQALSRGIVQSISWYSARVLRAACCVLRAACCVLRAACCPCNSAWIPGIWREEHVLASGVAKDLGEMMAQPGTLEHFLNLNPTEAIFLEKV